MLLPLFYDRGSGSFRAAEVTALLLVRSQRLELFVHLCEECRMHRCGAMHATRAGGPRIPLT
jgi:hypothetical protein